MPSAQRRCSTVPPAPQRARDQARGRDEQRGRAEHARSSSKGRCSRSPVPAPRGARQEFLDSLTREKERGKQHGG
eukprot:1786311-Lingulodinium_polyedra.AAC.1